MGAIRLTSKSMLAITPIDPTYRAPVKCKDKTLDLPVNICSEFLTKLQKGVSFHKSISLTNVNYQKEVTIGS